LHPHYCPVDQGRNEQPGQPVSANLVRVADGWHNDYHSVNQFNAVVFVQDAGHFHSQVLFHSETAGASQHGGRFSRGDDARRHHSRTLLWAEWPRRRQ
jgi:hypothetical protein